MCARMHVWMSRQFWTHAHIELFNLLSPFNCYGLNVCGGLLYVVRDGPAGPSLGTVRTLHSVGMAEPLSISI